ncbi:MAG: hypothetical protein ACMXYA_02620 [Candidatus Woesearchaeota archaeon]
MTENPTITQSDTRESVFDDETERIIEFIEQEIDRDSEFGDFLEEEAGKIEEEIIDREGGGGSGSGGGFWNWIRCIFGCGDDSDDDKQEETSET